MKAVLICAHGLKEEKTEDTVKTHCQRVSSLTGYPAFYGFSGDMSPSIKDTIGSMASEGFDEIVAVPLFFAPGFVATGMIPKAMGLKPGTTDATLTVDGKTVKVHLTGVFGNHPLMEKVMADIISSCGHSPKDTAVILIGHGSRDGINSATVEYNAAFVSKMGYRTVCAYNEHQSPSVEDALKDAVSSGCRHIIALPMFVSPSTHSAHEIPEKLGLKDGRSIIIDRDGEKIDLIYTQEVGMDPLIDDILAERVKEV